MEVVATVASLDTFVSLAAVNHPAPRVRRCAAPHPSAPTFKPTFIIAVRATTNAPSMRHVPLETAPRPALRIKRCATAHAPTHKPAKTTAVHAVTSARPTKRVPQAHAPNFAQKDSFAAVHALTHKPTKITVESAVPNVSQAKVATAVRVSVPKVNPYVAELA